MPSSKLHLAATVTYAGAIGYAEVFRCHVVEVLSGVLADTDLKLTVLPTDKATLDRLNAHQAPEAIELSFSLAEAQSQYATAPVTGFVDGERNLWRLSTLRVR